MSRWSLSAGEGRTLLQTLAALQTPAGYGNWGPRDVGLHASKRIEKFLNDYADRTGFYTSLPGLALAYHGTTDALSVWRQSRGTLLAIKVHDGAGVENMSAALAAVAAQARRWRFLFTLSNKCGLYRRTDGLRLLGMRGSGRRFYPWLRGFMRTLLGKVVVGLIVAANHRGDRGVGSIGAARRAPSPRYSSSPSPLR